MVNRFKLVDEAGRVLDKTGVDITIAFQDDGQTVIVWLKESANAVEERERHRQNFGESLVEGLADSIAFWVKRFVKGS